MQTNSDIGVSLGRRRKTPPQNPPSPVALNFKDEREHYDPDTCPKTILNRLQSEHAYRVQRWISGREYILLGELLAEPDGEEMLKWAAACWEDWTPSMRGGPRPLPGEPRGTLSAAHILQAEDYIRDEWGEYQHEVYKTLVFKPETPLERFFIDTLRVTYHRTQKLTGETRGQLTSMSEHLAKQDVDPVEFLTWMASRCAYDIGFIRGVSNWDDEIDDYLEIEHDDD